ncbi:unnamed protein product, partial [Amoebophrya sp. A25]
NPIGERSALYEEKEIENLESSHTSATYILNHEEKKEQHLLDPRECRLWVSLEERMEWLVLKRLRKQWKQ